MRSKATRNAISLPGSAAGRSPSDGQDSKALPEYGQGVAPASRSVAQGQALARQTIGICGPHGSSSLRHADRASSSESRSPAPQLSERLGDVLQRRLSRYGSMEYAQTWKHRVTPLGLRYWAHTASGRRTSGSGCTGSPTPRANDAEKRGQVSIDPRNGLVSSAALAGHPTTAARDWKDGRINQHGKNARPLNEVEMLAGHATPKIGNGGSGSPRRAVNHRGRLEDQCHGATTASTATSTAKTVGYRLNPGFSLWLMIGIPTIVAAWASCGVRAMQSCRCSRRSS